MLYMFGLYLVLMVIILGEALLVFIVGVAHKFTMFLSNGSDCSAVFYCSPRIQDQKAMESECSFLCCPGWYIKTLSRLAEEIFSVLGSNVMWYVWSCLYTLGQILEYFQVITCFIISVWLQKIYNLIRREENGQVATFPNRGTASHLDLMTKVCWLVVWNMFIHFCSPYIGNVIIPTVTHSIIFQRGRAQPPSSLSWLVWNCTPKHPWIHMDPMDPMWFQACRSTGPWRASPTAASWSLRLRLQRSGGHCTFLCYWICCGMEFHTARFLNLLLFQRVV